jgi:hypothetical protein
MLVSSLKGIDISRASALGTEEEFRAKEQLLSDIITAVDDFTERGRTNRL